MATAFVAKQERDVSSRESRQVGPQSDELFEQITEIVTAMLELVAGRESRHLSTLGHNQRLTKCLLSFHMR